MGDWAVWDTWPVGQRENATHFLLLGVAMRVYPSQYYCVLIDATTNWPHFPTLLSL